MKFVAVFALCLAAFFGFAWLGAWLGRVADLMPHGDVSAVQEANHFVVGAAAVLCWAAATFGAGGAIGTAIHFIESVGTKSFKEWTKTLQVKS